MDKIFAMDSWQYEKAIVQPNYKLAIEDRDRLLKLIKQ